MPLTGTDHVLGTNQYMSPEQIKASKDVDLGSDVWSLGVILFELVTQQQPFRSEGGGVGEMFAKILYVDPDPPSMHRKDLPEGSEAVVLMAEGSSPRSASRAADLAGEPAPVTAMTSSSIVTDAATESADGNGGRAEGIGPCCAHPRSQIASLTRDRRRGPRRPTCPRR